MELSNELEGVKRHHTVVMVGGKQQHGGILLVTFWHLDVVQCRYPARENIHTRVAQHYWTYGISSENLALSGLRNQLPYICINEYTSPC